MKKKHLPTRTCIACRRIKPKPELIRIVRGPDGVVQLDESGKANGRGCYVCQHFGCWHKTLRKRAGLLKRTLRTDFDRKTYLTLKNFAMQYKPPEEEKTEEATEAENQGEGEGTGTADGDKASGAEADKTTDAAAQAGNVTEKPTQEEKRKEVFVCEGF